jgi:hypothetical protein
MAVMEMPGAILVAESLSAPSRSQLHVDRSLSLNVRCMETS